MTDRAPDPSPNGNVAAVLMVVAAAVGLVLPIDFLLAVDGFRVFLRPPELVPLWGWAWLFYALYGLVLGTLAVLAARGLAFLLRRDPSALVQKAALWLSLSLICVSVIRSLKLWVGAHNVGINEWLGRNQGWIAVLVFIACAVAAHRDFADRRPAQRMIERFAILGFVLTAIAPVFCLLAGMIPSAPRAAAASARPRALRPDIIMVTADALAASHASFLGYGRPTTPNMDALAKEASVFGRYYANSNFTTASVNSFIDGVRPWTHRANQFLARVTTKISDDSLVARLKRSGYQTEAVWTNPLAAPFLNGSDRWLDECAYASTRYCDPLIASAISSRFPRFAPVSELGAYITVTKIWDRVAIWLGIWSMTDQYALEPAFSQARKFIDERDPTRPLFLWVHVLRPHSPYAAPAPFLGQFNTGPMMRTRYNSSPINEFFASKADDDLLEAYEGRYDESVLYLDSNVGAFVGWLKARGLFNQSILIVSSDHGESFSHRYGNHAGPMLHDDVIRVPLMIKEPGQTAGSRVDTLAEQIDLMPTVLDMAGVPLEGQVEGRSLRPAMHGQAMDGAVYSMNFEQNSPFRKLAVGSVAMIEGDWKYVRYLGRLHGPLIPKLTDALYNLRTDPGENSNLAEAEPSVSARMRAAIDEQLRLHDHPGE
jgi:arylsulfatase A-like enzyme